MSVKCHKETLYDPKVRSEGSELKGIAIAACDKNCAATLFFSRYNGR